MNIDIYSFKKIAAVLVKVNRIFKDSTENEVLGIMINCANDYIKNMQMEKKNDGSIATAGFVIMIFGVMTKDHASCTAAIHDCLADDILRLIKG